MESIVSLKPEEAASFSLHIYLYNYCTIFTEAFSLILIWALIFLINERLYSTIHRLSMSCRQIFTEFMTHILFNILNTHYYFLEYSQLFSLDIVWFMYANLSYMRNFDLKHWKPKASYILLQFPRTWD